MKRHTLLVIVGVALFVGGLLMPVIIESDQSECINPSYDFEEDEASCERTVTKEKPNPYRVPTIAVGFVVGIVGISIWGMDE